MSDTVPQLRLYNTLTRSKEVFTPIDPANVRMYVCGPTVYDHAHIGNARPVIVFDVLYRLLRHLYGPEHVTYVRNITDVDDKINARAARDFPGMALNAAIRAVTQKTADQFSADVLALGCLKPTHEPRATENITGMIDIIGKLLANGYAYIATGTEGREVLFSISNMGDYGQLSKRKLEDQQAGARVAVEAHKRNPGDFVLWKESSPDEPGWDSPWGRGRPGWHIECSAMSHRYLGETFDIHGGGLDLIFPHHENEIAQSRCAFGRDVMANVWMHNGFLQVEGQKMSKSLGNFVTIRELLETDRFGGKQWPGEVLRLAMLRTHYRQPIDWTARDLFDSEARLEKWKAFASERTTSNQSVSERKSWASFISFLRDDLNTSGALNFLDETTSNLSATDGERYFAFKALKLLGFKNSKSKVSLTVEATSKLLNQLSKFDSNDWQNLMGDVHRIPFKANGEMKLTSKLLANATILHDYFDSNLTRNHSVYSDLRYSKYLKDLRQRHIPKKTSEAERISSLITARLAARAAKNWAESDRIRDELAAQGIALKDNKDGTTTWEVKR